MFQVLFYLIKSGAILFFKIIRSVIAFIKMITLVQSRSFYQDILLSLLMSQRPISPITGEPFKVENYYFQVILNKLIAKRTVPSGPTQYFFTIFKDNQKYESTKIITLQLNSNTEYPLQACRVNFVAISYNPNKSLTFALRIIQNNEDVNKQLGEYIVDANNFIDHFNQSENGAFTLRINFNDDWAADVELYVEKSRYGVERLIRDIKNPKPKSEGTPAPISHQSIKEQRKKLDLEEKEDVRPHHHFNKFSSKRQVKEESVKKNQYFNRKKEQPEEVQTKRKVRAESPRMQPPKEEKKPPKGQFVPKKQWLIPEAEKYLNKKKVAAVNPPSTKDSRISEEKAASVKSEKPEPKTKPKSIEQPSFVERLPLQPKYIILIAILFILAFAASTIFKSTPPTVQPTKPSEASSSKPKKAGKHEKAQKPKKAKK